MVAVRRVWQQDQAYAEPGGHQYGAHGLLRGADPAADEHSRPEPVLLCGLKGVYSWASRIIRANSRSK